MKMKIIIASALIIAVAIIGLLAFNGVIENTFEPAYEPAFDEEPAALPGDPVTTPAADQ